MVEKIKKSESLGKASNERYNWRVIVDLKFKKSDTLLYLIKKPRIVAIFLVQLERNFRNCYVLF